MSNLSDFRGGVVKSVQRGVFSDECEEDSSTFITINQVNLAKSILIFNVIQIGISGGFWYTLGSLFDDVITNAPQVELYSATSIRVNMDVPLISDADFHVSFTWQVIEFY